MALDKSALAVEILDAMEAEGLFPRDSRTGSQAIKVATAYANAIVDHITANAEVPVSGGSSAGTYPVT